MIQGYTLEQALSNQSAKKTIHLGTFHSSAFEGTSALELITDMPLYFHGKIVDFYAITVFKDADVIAGAQTFTLDIGAVAVTGASISWDKDDAQGAIVSSTAITAANEFNQSDTITLHMAASGTGTTAGESSQVAFFIVVEELPGA